jgi:nucleotide-binding universal stress UspA family protein
MTSTEHSAHSEDPGKDDVARIVVGVDGSEPSVAALRESDRLARAFGAEIEAVTTWTYPAAYSAYAFTSVPSFEEIAQEIQEKALQDAFGTDRPSSLRAVIEQGHPASVLIERSKGAEMLVLGSRGYGGFTGLLLGSVSSECAAHAHCPVLIMH